MPHNVLRKAVDSVVRRLFADKKVARPSSALIEKLEGRQLLSTVAINFQASTTTDTPSGYLADTGATFASRGNGYSYGWSTSNTSNMRDRNALNSFDNRYDTVAFMNGTTTWKIALTANTNYQVRVVAGDPGATSSNLNTLANGTTVIPSFVAGNVNNWADRSAIVNSGSTGEIVISNGTAASNNRLQFVEITPQSELSVPTSVPTNLNVVAANYYSADILWDFTPASGERVTGFKVERKWTGIGADNVWREAGIVGADQHYFNDTRTGSDTWQLWANKSFVYRVSAYNSAGASSTSSETSITTPNTTSGSYQAPFNNARTAWSIDNKIEAENFDTGGQGVSYNDSNTSNSGYVYRNGGVDVTWADQATSSNRGYMIAWTAAGEWTKYTVNVPTAGTYFLEAKVSYHTAGGTFHVEFDGVDKTGALTIPNTGDWHEFQTISIPVTLSAGTQTMSIKLDTIGTGGHTGNLDWLQFTKVPAAPIDLSATAVSSTQIDLSWSASSGATGYNIYRDTTTGGESSTPINSTPITGTTFSDTSVSSNATYYYVVKALNGSAISAASAEVSVTTLSAPTTFGGSATSATSASFTWTDNSNGEANFLLWTYSGGTWVQVFGGTFAANATSGTRSNLMANTTYRFKLAAINSSGTSTLSNEVTFTTPSASTSPTATFSNDGPVDEGGYATVSFTNVVGDPEPLTFSYDFNNDGDFVDADDIDSSLDPIADVPASLLADGPTTKTIRGRVINDIGVYHDYTMTITINNVAPSLYVSGDPSATEGESYAISISADDSGLDTISQWSINWGDGSAAQIVTDIDDPIDHVFSGAAGEKTIVVTAIDEDGTYTSDLDVSLLPKAVTGISVTAIDYDSIKVNWSDESSIETGYDVRYSSNGIDWTLATTTAANSEEYTINGLSSGTSFLFDVVPNSASGSQGASGDGAQTNTPVATPEFEFERVDSDTINILYSIADGSNLVLEQLFPGDDNYHVVSTLESLPGEHEYEVDDLTALDTEYLFRIRADKNGFVEYAEDSYITAPVSTGYGSATLEAAKGGFSRPNDDDAYYEMNVTLTASANVTKILVQEKSELWPDSRWHDVDEYFAEAFDENQTTFQGPIQISHRVIPDFHYEYRYAAISNGVQGEWSEPIQIRREAARNAPTELSLLQNIPGQIVFRMDPHGSYYNGYNAMRIVDDLGNEYTADEWEYDYRLFNITPGRTYSARGVFYSWAEVVRVSQVLTVTNPLPDPEVPTAPTAPDNLRLAEEIDQKTGKRKGARLVWDDMSKDETGFKLQRKVQTASWDDFDTASDQFKEFSLGKNVESFLDNSIDPLTGYDWHILAINTTIEATYPEQSRSTPEGDQSVNWAIDMDVDSLNNKAISDSLEEEKAEDDPAAIGKVIPVNDSDNDFDGIPDLAEGYNLLGSNTKDDQPFGNFAELKITIPRGLDLSVATFQFDYDESKPFDDIATTSETTPIYTITKGHLRIWKKAGNSTRDGLLSAPGDFIGSKYQDGDPVEYNASELGFTNGNRSVTLFIEAVSPSDSAGSDSITVSVDIDGTGLHTSIVSDKVKVTSVKPKIKALNAYEGVELSTLAATWTPYNVMAEHHHYDRFLTVEATSSPQVPFLLTHTNWSMPGFNAKRLSPNVYQLRGTQDGRAIIKVNFKAVDTIRTVFLEMPDVGDRSAQSYALSYPLVTLAAGTWAKDKATAKALTYPGGNVDNTVGNALKHAYWNALLALWYGNDDDRVYKITRGHEYDARPYAAARTSVMDLYNNRVGIDVGLSFRAGVNEDDLVFITSDGPRMEAMWQKLLTMVDEGKFYYIDPTTQMIRKSDNTLIHW